MPKRTDKGSQNNALKADNMSSASQNGITGAIMIDWWCELMANLPHKSASEVVAGYYKQACLLISRDSSAMSGGCLHDKDLFR